MQWSSELDGSGNERNQMDVLDSLRPCLNLNKLCIQLYGGPEFPRWIGGALFSKMVDLRLIDCRKCTSLPCLGQLPSLKQLRIRGMVGVKKVGAEFYGETRVSAGKFFPSLESLHFESMSEWEHWEDWSSSTESLFPCLHELTIEYCSKLIMKLPTYLPSLTKLSVHFCPKLESPLSRLPLLKELQVSQCNEAVLSSGNDLTSLTKLTISRLPLSRLPNGWQSLTCLEELTISECPKLASFPDVGFPPKLRSLTVVDCKGLKSLPDGMMLKMRNDSTDSNNLCLLEKLVIYSCPSLICFPKGQLPTTLKRLQIKYCRDLKSLPEGMMGMCALEDLLIDSCHSLIGLPKGGLPATLKRLTITNCRRLESLPEGIMHQHSTNAAALQALEISSLKSLPEGMMHCNSIATTSTMDMCALEYLSLDTCPSLIGFPRGRLPITLKELSISDCEKLESLPEGIMHYDSTYAAALQALEIRGCPSLTSFPRGKFPSTLERLHIRDYERLESISEEMFYSTNNSLQSLTIWRYPNLKTLPDCLNTLTDLRIADFENLELLLPQMKNLTRLTALEIYHCKNIKTPLSQWGLSRLTSLKRLSIRGMFPDATSFSDDPHSIPFPTTLTSLSLPEFQNLESLASLSLQTLTSLENLVIECCPKLRSILPREGLFPDTLSRLRVRNCPHLTQRYSKEEGDDWPKIAHIPCVWIND